MRDSILLLIAEHGFVAAAPRHPLGIRIAQIPDPGLQAKAVFARSADQYHLCVVDARTEQGQRGRDDHRRHDGSSTKALASCRKRGEKNRELPCFDTRPTLARATEPCGLVLPFFRVARGLSANGYLVRPIVALGAADRSGWPSGPGTEERCSGTASTRRTGRPRRGDLGGDCPRPLLDSPDSIAFITRRAEATTGFSAR